MSESGHTRPDVHRPYWDARCRRLAAAVFLGRVLEFFGPAMLAGAALTACAILLNRLHVLPARFGAPHAYLPLIVATVLALIFAARRGWPRASDMRVRLEEACHLHNRLSAATEGAVDFPAPPGAAGGPTEDAQVVAWRWSQVLPLPTASLALLLVAVFVYLSDHLQASSLA